MLLGPLQVSLKPWEWISLSLSSPPARIVLGVTRMVGNVNRTQSLDLIRKREADAKQVSLTQILKCLKVSKYLPWKSIIILTWCWGTNQKYCASQQGDCKHIGYCDPNATCKKKANVSSNDDIEDQAMWLLAEVYDLVKTFPFSGWQVRTVLAVRMQQGVVWWVGQWMDKCL